MQDNQRGPNGALFREVPRCTANYSYIPTLEWVHVTREHWALVADRASASTLVHTSFIYLATSYTPHNRHAYPSPRCLSSSGPSPLVRKQHTSAVNYHAREITVIFEVCQGGCTTIQPAFFSLVCVCGRTWFVPWYRWLCRYVLRIYRSHIHAYHYNRHALREPHNTCHDHLGHVLALIALSPDGTYISYILSNALI